MINIYIVIIECLISGDVVNTMKRITPYYNHLRDLLPCNDISVMEIAARTLVKLANLPGSKGAESFEFDIKRAFEWLSGDRHEVSEICTSLSYHCYSYFNNKWNSDDSGINFIAKNSFIL